MVIKWHLGIFKKITKPSIYQEITGAKALIKERRWIMTFRNIPREFNSAADDMARRARVLSSPGSIRVTPASLNVTEYPKVDLEAIY